MRSPKLAALELRRFRRGKLPAAALVALLLLPLLYGALYLFSFWDPYGNLDKLPVALVNNDKGATSDGKRVNAGDEISEKLLDSNVFAWHEVSSAEAEKGVEDGTYYLSLTMPSDFSKKIASSGGDSPETGALQVRTNDANNYIVGQISKTVFGEVRNAASTNASRGFLDRIFINFSDLHDKTADAAKGADDLKGGISKAKKGSKELADGLKDSKAGTERLSDGIVKLNTGAGEVASGARQVAGGTQALADKVNGAAGEARPFFTYFKENGKSIGEAARLAADGAKTTREDLGKLVAAAPKAAADARTAADELGEVHRTRCEEAEEPDEASCPALKKAGDAASDAATTAAEVSSLVTSQNGELKTLSSHLAAFQKQAENLAKRAPTLESDLERAVKDINALNTGAQKVAKGAVALHTGLGNARTGSADLNTGVGKLKTGAENLDGGLFRLGDGSAELAQGLHDGAEKIPDYEKKDRDARTDVMADPVKLASKSLHAAPNYGTGFAPYFIPLSLWVGAMVAYMIIQPLNKRALSTGASAWRIALAGWLPVAAIGVLQVGALIAVLHWGLGLEMERSAGTVAFLALVTCCFASIVQWLNACFGAAGRILVLVVLMLQLTSAGGTYPVQTSPGFFGAIHPYLPMTYVVEGLRRLITGGPLGPVWLGCAVLGAFTLGALALTAWTARRKQVWSLSRLHPELSL
ncbi:YhgE/Pip domain-containing protein [Streptomyces sp. NPDC012600]|uniref:YhgE/Pip domain-containing protein n=3 Tax=Streptomyces TaxID=1883 RepID=A0ABU2W6T6_9ACTN|nr:YhgE/Pip domain-containing protein [Streptomyces griseus]MDT0493014.1 YhgE/Pip domain-containing protein [Streptomyces griseus]